MPFALKVLVRTCERFDVILKFDYIPSYENGIEDAISRDRWVEAQKWISKNWWSFHRKKLSPYRSEWEIHLLALGSTHSTLGYFNKDPEDVSSTEAYIENLTLAL